MKKSDRITLRETLSIHLRAVRDANNVAPGIFFLQFCSPLRKRFPHI